jgi:hypothetical protein
MEQPEPHRIARAVLHEALAKLERQGETVVSITAADDDFYTVVTRWHTDRRETRGAA